MKDFLNGMILDSVTKLDRSYFSILPPTSFLIKVNIKGEGGSNPRLDGLFHFLRKTILHVETDLPDLTPAFDMNILDGRSLAEGREGKDQDQKEGDPPSEPNVLTSMLHRVYLRLEIPISKLETV